MAFDAHRDASDTIASGPLPAALADGLFDWGEQLSMEREAKLLVNPVLPVLSSQGCFSQVFTLNLPPCEEVSFEQFHEMRQKLMSKTISAMLANKSEDEQRMFQICWKQASVFAPLARCYWHNCSPTVAVPMHAAGPLSGSCFARLMEK